VPHPKHVKARLEPDQRQTLAHHVLGKLTAAHQALARAKVRCPTPSTSRRTRCILISRSWRRCLPRRTTHPSSTAPSTRDHQDGLRALVPGVLHATVKVAGRPAAPMQHRHRRGLAVVEDGPHQQSALVPGQQRDIRVWVVAIAFLLDLDCMLCAQPIEFALGPGFASQRQRQRTPFEARPQSFFACCGCCRHRVDSSNTATKCRWGVRPSQTLQFGKPACKLCTNCTSRHCGCHELSVSHAQSSPASRQYGLQPVLRHFERRRQRESARARHEINASNMS